MMFVYKNVHDGTAA